MLDETLQVSVKATRKGLNATRGGRVSRRGFRLFWAGLSMLIALLIAGIARAPGPVIWTLMGILFAMAFTGLGLVYAGHRIDDRALAEYHRRVEAGEQPPWQPGDPNPLG